jgi:hypothetical protein
MVLGMLRCAQHDRWTLTGPVQRLFEAAVGIWLEANHATGDPKAGTMARRDGRNHACWRNYARFLLSFMPMGPRPLLAR